MTDLDELEKLHVRLADSSEQDDEGDPVKSIPSDVQPRLSELVSRGLVSGVGSPNGQLCIMSAVSLAMGEPHGDEPSCVAAEDRRWAIAMNDAPWSSPEVRAKHMLPVGLAMLGTAGTDRFEWVKRLGIGNTKRVVPWTLRKAAEHNPELSDELVAAAARCEAEGTPEAARHARQVARRVGAAAYAYAAYAAADAASTAADAAYAASYASYAAYAAYAAYASAYAYAYNDEVLSLGVQVALDAYRAGANGPETYSWDEGTAP